LHKKASALLEGVTESLAYTGEGNYTHSPKNRVVCSGKFDEMRSEIGRRCVDGSENIGYNTEAKTDRPVGRKTEQKAFVKFGGSAEIIAER
jgi:hypothetical protein